MGMIQTHEIRIAKNAQRSISIAVILSFQHSRSTNRLPNRPTFAINMFVQGNNEADTWTISWMLHATWSSYKILHTTLLHAWQHYMVGIFLSKLSTSPLLKINTKLHCTLDNYGTFPTFQITYYLWDLFRSRTNRITTKFKLGSNISATIQWPSSVQYRQYNCMRINTAKQKVAGINST